MWKMNNNYDTIPFLAFKLCRLFNATPFFLIYPIRRSDHNYIHFTPNVMQLNDCHVMDVVFIDKIRKN